ncbi:MarR family transcriptional regulator [Streptomyces sp. NHF165]|uniref:MarR family winged helix-turn-helix transcriptional regulator n=1 Tax=Streptomyces sp. NHF165 TaxID=2175864 RepID=UPI00132EBD82|nr:MarR family winged helix-turn-helix transcriptional regulator [Streptomyces sp. NHF165]QHF94585.1 MarR family transcriptional regulator [Streptomyces sp. NHF165]
MDATEPKWLNEEETRTWLALVALATRLPAALDTQMQRDAGMTHFEYHVMAALSMAPEGALRPRDLAATAGSSLSRVSHLLRRLENKGWIERTPDPDDSRYSYASLTPAGQEKMARTAPDHVATARRLVFDALTPAQQRQLTTIGERICTAIEQSDARDR